MYIYIYICTERERERNKERERQTDRVKGRGGEVCLIYLVWLIEHRQILTRVNENEYLVVTPLCPHFCFLSHLRAFSQLFFSALL